MLRPDIGDKRRFRKMKRDEYYMYDRMYPGIGIAVSISY